MSPYPWHWSWGLKLQILANHEAPEPQPRKQESIGAHARSGWKHWFGFASDRVSLRSKTSIVHIVSQEFGLDFSGAEGDHGMPHSESSQTATEIQLPPEKAVAGKEFLQNEELKLLVQNNYCKPFGTDRNLQSGIVWGHFFLDGSKLQFSFSF